MMQLEEALETLIESKLEAVHTAFPAVVQSYDGHSKRTCTVVPATNLMLSDGTIVEAVPIPGVPVVFPSSHAGGILFPIKNGDMVIVVVSETAIGNWLAGTGSVVDPEDSTRFTMHDAMAIPGIWPSLAIPETQIGAKSGGMEFNNAVIELTKAGKFKIRNRQATAKELLDDLWAEVDAFANAVQTFATSTSAAAVEPTLAPASAALLASITALRLEIATKSAKVATILE